LDIGKNNKSIPKIIIT